MVVRNKLATQEQVDECLATVREAAGGAAPKSLRSGLLRRGIINETQAATVDKAILHAGQIKQGLPNTPATRRIAGYEIIGKIGAGGMGTVFRARQLSMDRDVAIKILPRELAADRSFVERFIQEARAAGMLNHMNIVAGLDVGPDSGLYYFVMEYVPGETVRHMIERLGPTPEGLALSVATQIARAIEHAFGAGLVHRDIKPANIMVTTDGTAKLMDLGLVLSTAEAADPDRPVDTMATPYYVSPEQASGEAALDTRADIYSLGATLYHMLTGRVPFDGPTAPVVMTKRLTDDPPDPRAAQPGLSSGLCSVLSKMMARQPSDRYKDATQLLKDLGLIAEGRMPQYALAFRPAASVRAAASVPAPGTARIAAQPRRRGGKSMSLRDRRAVRARGYTDDGDEDPRPIKKRSPLVLALIAGSILGLVTGVIILAVMFLPRYLVYGSRLRPEPEPTPTVAPKPLADPASVKFAAATRFAVAHPDDHEGIIREFEAIVAEFPDTKWADNAGPEIYRARQYLKREAGKQFDELRQATRSLAGQDKFAEAAEALTAFIAQYGHTDWDEKVAAEKVLIETLAGERLLHLTGRARLLTEADDSETAMALLNKVMAFGMPGLASRAKSQISSVRRAAANAVSERQRRVRFDYTVASEDVGPLLAARRYTEAAARARDVAAEDRFATIRDEIADDRREMEELALIIRDAEAGGGAMVGQRFSVKQAGNTVSGTIDSAADGKILLSAGGAKLTFSIGRLTPAEVYQLAAAAPGSDANATARRYGLMLAWDDRPDEALAQLEKLSRKGLDVGAVMPRIRWRKMLAAEIGAANLWERAGRLAGSGRWDEVNAALAELQRERGGTDFVRNNTDRIASLQAQAEGGRAYPGRFRAPVEDLGNAEIALTYAFKAPGELRDWDAGAGSISIRDGRLEWRTRGAGTEKLEFLPARLRADTLRVSFDLEYAGGGDVEVGVFAGIGGALLSAGPGSRLGARLIPDGDYIAHKAHVDHSLMRGRVYRTTLSLQERSMYVLVDDEVSLLAEYSPPVAMPARLFFISRGDQPATFRIDNIRLTAVLQGQP